MKRLFAAGAALGLMALGTPAAASAAPTTAYVSPSGSVTGADHSCRTAGYSSISAAVAAAPVGGTVVVCHGSYNDQVVVTKSLTLIGHGATINANGQMPLKVGPMTLPGSIGIGVLQTSNVQVSGFHVINAGFDAILVGLSTHVSVWGNALDDNGDVGVDINGSSWSRAVHNVSEDNKGGGYLVADDVGPNSHNTVAWNVASHNPGGCGVIVAGHSTAGVTDNWVGFNLLTDNGTLKSSGGGAGVVIASEVPGEIVADNTVVGNVIYGNGLAGVTIHAHLPGQNLNGNRIIGNVIGPNNTLGDPIGLTTPPTSTKNLALPDKKTTGILVGSASPITVWIAHNRISHDYFGIFLEGVGKVISASLDDNSFRDVNHSLKEVIAS